MTNASEDEDPTSIFESSIYSLFDIHNPASGDPGEKISYHHPNLHSILPKTQKLDYFIPNGDSGNTGLMAQFQWDAGLVLSDLISENLTERYTNSMEVKGRTTLELGAGTGLPSLVAHLMGSRTSVVTDYPSPDVLETLRRNVAVTLEQVRENRMAGEQLEGTGSQEFEGKLFVEGIEWGKKEHEQMALRHLSNTCPSTGFDLVLTTDTLWLTKSHDSLISTMKRTLSFQSDSRIILVAGFHTGRGVVEKFLSRTFKARKEDFMKSQKGEEVQTNEELKRLDARLIPDESASRFGGIWEQSFEGEERAYLDWNENWLKEGVEGESQEVGEEDDDRDERARWCVIACLKFKGVE